MTVILKVAPLKLQPVLTYTGDVTLMVDPVANNPIVVKLDVI
jgi:hypothetical protein